MSKLDAIRQREQAAWPGDWHDSPTDDPAPFFVFAGPSSYVVADVFRAEDAAFIAHARADVPLLLSVTTEVACLPLDRPHTGVVEEPGEWLVVRRSDWERIRAALAPLLEPEG